jgi:hypothetical protein
MRSHRCKTLNKALEIQKTESLRPIYEEQDTLMNNKTNITASSQPYTIYLLTWTLARHRPGFCESPFIAWRLLDGKGQ